jgi:hypothetical protein
MANLGITEEKLNELQKAFVMSRPIMEKGNPDDPFEENASKYGISTFSNSAFNVTAQGIKFFYDNDFDNELDADSSRKFAHNMRNSFQRQINDIMFGMTDHYMNHCAALVNEYIIQAITAEMIRLTDRDINELASNTRVYIDFVEFNLSSLRSDCTDKHAMTVALLSDIRASVSGFYRDYMRRIRTFIYGNFTGRLKVMDMDRIYRGIESYASVQFIIEQSSLEENIYNITDQYDTLAKLTRAGDICKPETTTDNEEGGHQQC